MRHSRSTVFADAWRSEPRARWNAATADPNDPVALAHRARTLEAAWMPQIADRTAFLVDRCRDRRVLDIGCVAHDVARFDDPSWLHRRLADVAETCVGVDILADAVIAMNDAGFDAIAHDLSTGLGPLADRGPFDVVVAGELIEHVSDLDFLFVVARETLAPGGQLILTTPNPYAPSRVRAGQRGIVWENADHVTYLFPSGVAELAERNGLELTGATTVADPRPERGGPLRRLRRAIRGSVWRNVGYDTERGEGRQAVVGGGLLDRFRRDGSSRFLGETSVYVIGRLEGT